MALRRVKGHLLRIDGLLNFEIDKSLLASVKTSRQRYELDLMAKRRIAEENEKRERKLPKIYESEILRLNDEIAQRVVAMRAAELAVEEGNKELQKALLKKPLRQLELQTASSKIEMGLKRKSELDDAVAELEKKRAAYSNRN